MNRNRKKAVAASVAVGMTMVMGVSPVLAANTDISKEETVYVNANADGSEDQITVSNWLKNAGTEKNLKDESELKDIKKRKGRRGVHPEWKQADLADRRRGYLLSGNNHKRASGFREVHLLSGRQGNQTG